MRVPDCPDETSTTWRTGQESIKKPGPEAGPGSRDRHLDHGGPVRPAILLFPLGGPGAPEGPSGGGGEPLERFSGAPGTGASTGVSAGARGRYVRSMTRPIQ